MSYQRKSDLENLDVASAFEYRSFDCIRRDSSAPNYKNIRPIDQIGHSINEKSEWFPLCSKVGPILILFGDVSAISDSNINYQIPLLAIQPFVWQGKRLFGALNKRQLQEFQLLVDLESIDTDKSTFENQPTFLCKVKEHETANIRFMITSLTNLGVINVEMLDSETVERMNFYTVFTQYMNGEFESDRRNKLGFTLQLSSEQGNEFPTATKIIFQITGQTDRPILSKLLSTAQWRRVEHDEIILVPRRQPEYNEAEEYVNYRSQVRKRVKEEMFKNCRGGNAPLSVVSSGPVIDVQTHNSEFEFDSEPIKSLVLNFVKNIQD